MISWALFSLVFILISKYLWTIFTKYFRLEKDYQSLSLLPRSSIGILGNLPQLDPKPSKFFQLISQLSQQCQEQGKGLFCLWYAIWPMIFFCSAKTLENFISNSKQLVKSFDYTLFEPWLKEGLVTSNRDKWRSRRRLITPSFHNTELLNNFMTIFNEQSIILAQRLEQLSSQSNIAHDLFPYISACTLDVIAEAATGTHLRAQYGNEKHDFVEATGRINEIIQLRMRTPWMWPATIFDRISIGKDHKKALDVLHGFSRKVIQERLATFNAEQKENDLQEPKKSTRRLVFLDSLITQMQAEKLTLEDIQEEVDTFMFAGHDTTSAAINFFCYLMGRYPEVQAKVHEELDSIFGDDEERMCTMEDTHKMTYLDCVIKEAMRILPPVPQIAREAQEDFLYKNQVIRKGTTIYIFIYGIHHDATVFPDPERFDPSRFADTSLTSDQRSPFAFIPFSAGSRNCIGQRFAGLEERVVLSTLFRRFSFRARQSMEELDLSMGSILRAENPIQITVERRKPTA